MSKIDKLSILGVRSFDNRVAETIQFYAPLTLIVGLNGSGKTTVIECLKYVTTGELPPNCSRGGAFIHDPQLCGEREVLAQVKMSFKSTTGVPMVVTRNMQLTVKKTTRSQKALEGQLQMIKDGERTSISSRVSELDQMLPHHLGVSKAILEYVIFCHQDESLWPLSEPAALKKRFDEIFEAMKYTKAVENIKAIRKKQTEELGKLKIIEQHAREDKEKADRDQQRMNTLYDEIEALREKALGVAEQIKDVSAKADDAWTQASQFDSIISNLNGKRIEASAHRKGAEELKHYVKEMSDSDEELTQKLEQYDGRLAEYEQEMNKLNQAYSKLAGEITVSRQELKKRTAEIGRCEAERDEYRRKLASRESAVKAFAAKHGIRGYEHSLDDSRVGDFSNQLERLEKEKHAELDRVRRENQEKLDVVQQELTTLSQKRNMLSQKRDSHRSLIESNEEKIKDFRQQINRIDVDVGTKAKLEAAVADIQNELEQAKAMLTREQFAVKIAAAEEQIRQQDGMKETLNAELLKATTQAGDTARLDYLQKELARHKASLDSMSSTHQTELSALLGGDFDAAALEQQFLDLSDERATFYKKAENELAAAERDIQERAYKLDTMLSEQRDRQAEMERHKKLIQAVLEPDQPITDFPETLQKLSRSLEIVKTDSSNFAEMRMWYEKCLTTVKGQGICRLCQQNVKDGKDKQAFVQRLEKQIARATATALEEEIRDAEDEWSRADAVRANYDSWRQLSEEVLPKLTRNVDSLQRDKDAAGTRLHEVEERVQLARSKKEEIDAVSKTVQAIVKYYTEVASLEEQVQSLSEKTATAGLSRPVGVIQTDIKNVDEIVKKAQTLKNELSSQQADVQSRINGLELDGRDAKSRLADTIHKLDMRAGLDRYIAELVSTNAAQTSGAQACEADIGALVPLFSAAQARLADVRRASSSREAEVQADAGRLSESANQLRLMDRQIRSYIERGGDQQLEAAAEALEEIEMQLIADEERQRAVDGKIKAVDEQRRSYGNTKREIMDNVRYRDTLRQLSRIEAEIVELEGKNAEADKETFVKLADKWNTARNRLTGEQASIMGELKGKDDQLQALIEVWESDYKDAAFKFREANVKVVTTKAVVDDLGRYGGALDQAIMRYHSLKMEEINRIVEDLWKKTYQGNDVDTIKIKSDSETAVGKAGGAAGGAAGAAGTSSTAATTKSYNYRVVMVKADAEMDMRGRCSAGQKVLASIIIRLALAECFGVNCGLIALDEPTTNLDAENIRALALSLHEIIKIRRQQANFQLIVITHDEEFLRAMQCADFADSYWRISRNPMMKSVIERQRISEVI